MAKKRTPVKNAMHHLMDQVREKISILRDDCAESISEHLESDDENRFENIKQAIEGCKAAVEKLHDILDWCEGVERDEEEAA